MSQIRDRDLLNCLAGWPIDISFGRKPPRFCRTGSDLRLFPIDKGSKLKRNELGILPCCSFSETNVIFLQKRSALQNIRLVECSIAELMRRINNVTVRD
jgi:hypothetical protein